MKHLGWLGGLVAGLILLAPPQASAGIIAISNPGDIVPGTGQTYTSYTTLLPITAPNFTNFSSLSNGEQTVTFSSALNARTVPGSWLTWSSPPFSETATPRVGYSNGQTSLTMTLSTPVDVFGFELEPNPFSPITFTASYFNGATLLGQITRSVNGSAGARLFAGVESGGALITRVVISGSSDFAIAQVRYHTPEPASIVLFGALGLGSGAFWWSRRKKASATPSV